MKSLNDVVSFGGTDADNDDILLQAFEDHEAYQDILAQRRHMIIEKKGSGKTAIFKKIITTKEYDFFSYGHTFSDYPWHHHEKQARTGIPNFDKYTHSWKYLILVSTAKIILNQDQSLPFDDVSQEAMSLVESFIVDSYGSRDPDLTQIFSPTKKLKVKSKLGLNLGLGNVSADGEQINMDYLPAIVQDLNKSILAAVLDSLNPDHRYFIAFDQLDLGFDKDSDEYKNRLIGLLLACRDINLAAKRNDTKLFVVIFLRDDIYDCLHFEDKNKMTENYVRTIEWDTQSTNRTLKGLMEKRFDIVLKDNDNESIMWDDIFNEAREMPGHQSKYDHIIDRTYLRPRDIIKFANCALSKFKERNGQGNKADHSEKIDNIDVQNARIEYSEYFLREIDDEVHKHIPEFDNLLAVVRQIGTWQFEKGDFENAYLALNSTPETKSDEVIERLFNHSFIGFYRVGGSGFGGSRYVFRYRELRTQFDKSASRFRVHPGLIEVLGLKRK